MSMYRYQPLRHEDSFRLLVLHPSSNETESIVCTILHARLSDVTLEFKAISYTWGDNFNRQKINFRDNESELQIGQNCHSALCHLRQKNHDQLIWMDAICIDQENLEELFSQVRLMHRIYSRAVSVRVFLGEETEGSRLLFEELAEADRLLLEGAKCDRPQPSEAIVQELETLFRRPWFRRVWVLQEVWDKKSVVFMCGLASASSKALYQCTFAYVGELVTQELCPMALSLAEGERDAEEEGTPELNLWTQLYWSRTCLATDPRDKIFALKSLLGLEQWKISYLIDYTKSVEEIYIMTAEFLWPALKIRMLAASKHPHNMNMPSWCPDWCQKLPLDEIHMLNLLFNIAPDDDSSFLHAEDENGVCSFEDEESLPEMHLKGTRYAQTVHKSQLFSFKDFNDAQRQMRELFVEIMTCEKVTSLYVEDHPVSSNQLGPHILKVAREIDEEDLATYLLKGRLRKSFQEWNSQVVEPDLVYNFYYTLQQCRVILLDNGQLCIAPEGTEVGDTVCIFAKSLAPCILRPNSLGKWRLISGDCFVFQRDYRRPGSWSDFGCDTYLKDMKLELEEFIIQ